MNYWDATGEAIKTVDPAYVFGGPGNAHILSDTFKAVLNHAEHGTNAITGAQGSVLDFISVHHKALPREMIRMERRSLQLSPEALNTAQYRDLITRGEPMILERRKALTGNRFSVDLPGSALSMLILSEPGNDPPPPAPEIQSVTPYTSFEGGRKDFVRWTQAGRGIQSFHVQVSHDGGAFETVTNAPVLALGFTYVWPGGVDEVRYRVVALPL